MNSQQDQTIAPLLNELCEKYSRNHGAHTILLYGSRATGQESATSDIDIAAFGTVDNAVRDAFDSNGLFVDGFIYPEGYLDTPTQEHLRLRNSRILVDLKGRAAGFLEQLNILYATGPEPLPEDEKQARRAWAGKMLLRIAGGGIDARYRRVWLLTDMLEDYFDLRGLWYEGPARSLRRLEEHEPEVYTAISKALDPGAGNEEIRHAVGLVYQSEKLS